MAEGESPENPGEKEGDRTGENEMQHEPGRLPERLDEEPRRDICHDHDRDDPAENKAKDARENDIRVAGDVEEVEVAVDETLGADDPETYRGQGEHDRVMHRDAETNRDQVKRDH